jgi:hypothetical protein
MSKILLVGEDHTIPSYQQSARTKYSGDREEGENPQNGN